MTDLRQQLAEALHHSDASPTEMADTALRTIADWIEKEEAGPVGTFFVTELRASASAAGERSEQAATDE